MCIIVHFLVMKGVMVFGFLLEEALIHCNGYATIEVCIGF